MRFAPCAMRPEGPRAASSELPGKGPSLRRMVTESQIPSDPRRMQFLKRLVRHMPDPILVAAGRLLYRHFG